MGNVLTTVSDKRLAIDNNTDGEVDDYTADIISATDYYPFDMIMPGRNGYRGQGGWVSQAGSAGPDRGYTASIDLNNPRTTTQPSEYVAAGSIQMNPGFESAASDDFVAYIDDSGGGVGGSSGSGDGSTGSSNGYYRYGFNGKENDNEVKGIGNQQDYGLRIYDPRIGKFLSTDPLSQEYPDLTSYQFASNTPIWAIDIDGAEGMIAMPDERTARLYNYSAEAIKKIIVEKHSQGMRNVSIAEHARGMAIKQGRVDGDGITWLTKASVYFAPWWNSTATFSDANDGAVLISGKNLDGSKAGINSKIKFFKMLNNLKRL